MVSDTIFVRTLRVVLAALLLAASSSASALAMPHFDQLEQKLKIRPEQKEQYDAAVAATQRALLSVAVTAMEFKEKLDQELSKPRPDFRFFFDLQDDVIERNRALFKEAGDEWQKLYQLLDDEQVDIARRFLRENLGSLFRLERLDRR